MRVFIADFERENYGSPACLQRRPTAIWTSLLATSLFASVPACADSASQDAAYKALIEITKVAPRDAQSDDCTVKATVHFASYTDKLPIFREAFLDRDFSEDFYRQRRKQVFSYLIIKRAAELLTEGLYNGHTQPECKFSLKVDYPDKFGQNRSFEAVTWRFNDTQAAKVNWEKFDPRNFMDIALDYRISDRIDEWIGDEPKMLDSKQQSEPVAVCDMFMFNANAMFFRATTFCGKNYLDSPAGDAALEGAKKCMADEASTRAQAGKAMRGFDDLLKQKGRRFACGFANEVSRQVLQKAQ